jgi:hypothetical protein
MLYNKISYLNKKFVFSSSYQSSYALEYCGKMSEKHFELIYLQHVPSIIFINLFRACNNNNISIFFSNIS